MKRYLAYYNKIFGTKYAIDGLSAYNGNLNDRLARKEKRYAAIDKEIEKFSSKWFVPYDDVKYEAYNFKGGELANENKLKALADYATYKEQTPDALPKFKFNGTLVKEFKEVLMPEISLLLE